VVKLFVGLGNDVNQADDYGITPLMAAANYGDVPIIQYLIDVGADLSAHDLGRRTTGSSVQQRAADAGRLRHRRRHFRAQQRRHHSRGRGGAHGQVMKERGIVPHHVRVHAARFSCSQAKVDPKVATPAEIMRARKLAVGHQIEGLTGGLEAK
jgi:hypothetical protein